MVVIEDINQHKIELRKKYRKLRKEVQNKEEASYALLQNYINNVIIEELSIVSGYMPMDGEIDVLPLMNYLIQQKHMVALPVVDKNSKVLLFHQWNTSNSVIPNVLIVPLVAFDKYLNRLGFGGGYYDNTISTLRPHCKVIGVAYDLQLCDKVPIESHDQVLDMILTEKNVYKKA
ncbi:5-formyltetrahydrofolate cyclo-ligase [Ehrlichia sp. JZT12]